MPALVDGSHTGARIAAALTSGMEAYSLDEKLFYIVSDNASNMRKAFDIMKAIEETVTADDDNGRDDGNHFAFDDEQL